MLEVMPPLASRKVFTLRNHFRFLLYRSGRKLALVCVTYLSVPASPGCSRREEVQQYQKLCALFPTAKCSVRNVKETNPAIAHAAFVPQSALCCCKLALFIKCVYLAADLLLHMNN